MRRRRYPQIRAAPRTVEEEGGTASEQLWGAGVGRPLGPQGQGRGDSGPRSAVRWPPAEMSSAGRLGAWALERPWCWPS